MTRTASIGTEAHLKATRADRAIAMEDLRIARKHEAEAAARIMSNANHYAYLQAREWRLECMRRAEAAVADAIAAHDAYTDAHRRPADEI